MSHDCHCPACSARRDRVFTGIVDASYAPRSLERLERLAAPMLEPAPADCPDRPDRESVAAVLDTLERAESLARASGDSVLADRLYSLACAIGRRRSQ